eukprot:353638-Chlamydomonas_euryale.AAC.3
MTEAETAHNVDVRTSRFCSPSYVTRMLGVTNPPTLLAGQECETLATKRLKKSQSVAWSTLRKCKRYKAGLR